MHLKEVADFTSFTTWVTFHLEGEQMTVRCAGCRTSLGYVPADPFAKDEMARQIGAIREAGHAQHKPAN
jgi:hypothetical protein